MAAATRREFFRSGGKFVFALAWAVLAGSAGPALAQAARAGQEDVLRSLTYTFGGVTGLEIISGLRQGPGGIITTVGVGGRAQTADGGQSFRIGSQSKMFTAAVVLDLIDGSGGALTLDSRLAEIANGYPAVKDKLPEGLVERAGGLTLRQLLNMGTDLPNYLGGIPEGQSLSIFELWRASTGGGAANGYGPVAGYTSADPQAHTNLAGLILGQPPLTWPEGGLFTGAYSNTNAIILALITEGLTGVDFDVRLGHWLASNNLVGAYLQMSQGNADFVGTFNGLPIDNLDPAIPWVSGAVVTTMEDLLKALELFNSDPVRMASGNTTIINMHGLPTIYGLGLMSLDFSFISGLLGAPVALSPIVSTGHGGAIAGSGSFSGWLTQADGVGLNSGLAAYANVTNAFSRGGLYTETPSETLFVTLAEHLYRITRSDGDYVDILGDVTINYGAAGGYAATDFPGPIRSLTFAKNAGQTIPLIAYFDWDSLTPGDLAINLDPVFTHYSLSSDHNGSTSNAETVFVVSGLVDLPQWARMEGYSGDKSHPDSSYTLLTLLSANVTDRLLGQVAVYGSQAAALKALRPVELGPASVIEAHGYDSTALELWAAPNTIKGRVLGAGAKITAVSVGGGAGAVIGENAEILAHSYGSSQIAFGTLVEALENGATGVLMGDQAQLTVNGLVKAWSENPESAVSVGLSLGAAATARIDGGQVVSDGLGARLTGAGGLLSLNDAGYLSGSQYAVLVENTAATAALSLAGGSRVVGQIKVEDPGLTAFSLTADASSTLVAGDYSQAAVDGARAVILNGTSVTWLTADLPERGRAITVIDNYSAADSVLNYRPDFGDRGALSYAVHQGLATVYGLAAGAGRSPNAPGVYDGWRAASLGAGCGLMFLGDADNLTHEPFVTLAGAALDAHRQNTGLARRALFPYETAGPVYSAPGYLNARPAGSGSGPAALAALYDRQAAAGPLAGWTPANPENRALLLAADDGPGALTGPLPAADSSGRWRFVGNYFHAGASRDDNRYSGYDHDRDGLFLGAAVEVSSQLSLAGFFGWSQGQAEFNYLQAQADTESTFAGLAGRWRQEIGENLAARLTGHLSLSRMDNDLNRTVTGSGGLHSRLSGSFKQTVAGGGLEAALDWAPFGRPGARLSPWLAVDYAHLKQKGLRERAADPAPTALWAEGFDADAFFASVGLALAHDFKLSDAHILTVKGSAAGERQFGGRRFMADGGFIAGGSSFQAQSLEMNREAAVLGLTLDSLHRLDAGGQWGLSAGFETRLMSGGRDQRFNLGLEYRF